MTPKEYRSFSAGEWNGIEIRQGGFNWEPYEFKEQNPLNSRKTERRASTSKASSERRKGIRRKKDVETKADKIAFYVCSNFALFLLIVWFMTVIFYNVYGEGF